MTNEKTKRGQVSGRSKERPGVLKKPVRVCVVLDTKHIKRVDRLAKAMKTSRSRAIRALIESAP